MKVLELIHSLEEAYDRFGDIEVSVWKTVIQRSSLNQTAWGGKPIELIIESEEFIIKCE